MGIQGYTWVYKGILRFARVYRGIQGHARVYKGMLRFTRVY